MLFRKIDERITPFRPGERVMKTERTANVVYADGRQEPMDVPPYQHEVTLPGNAEALLSAAELADCGLLRAEPVPFVPTAGKIAAGGPRYQLVGGEVHEVYDEVDAPPPPPPPTAVERADAMARSYGFASRAEMLAALQSK